ncbi:hypothetical protein DFJ74DRAFT_701958 [Hyaloraphidium curvatum]|nr:hypothetical protein DFJ74DRAFT_701958 [Hyaloraphidium curvatum]
MPKDLPLALRRRLQPLLLCLILLLVLYILTPPRRLPRRRLPSGRLESREERAERDRIDALLRKARPPSGNDGGPGMFVPQFDPGELERDIAERLRNVGAGGGVEGGAGMPTGALHGHVRAGWTGDGGEGWGDKVGPGWSERLRAGPGDGEEGDGADAEAFPDPDATRDDPGSSEDGVSGRADGVAKAADGGGAESAADAKDADAEPASPEPKPRIPPPAAPLRSAAPKGRIGPGPKNAPPRKTGVGGASGVEPAERPAADEAGAPSPTDSSDPRTEDAGEAVHGGDSDATAPRIAKSGPDGDAPPHARRPRAKSRPARPVAAPAPAPQDGD